MSFLTGGANLGTAYGAIVIGTDSAIRNLNILGGALRASAASAMATGRDFQALGIIVATAGAGMQLAFRDIVGTGMSFDKEMSAVAATIGDVTVPVMEQLREKAIEIGRDTSFSATQAAQAMEELAKAGVSAEGILNGVADATVNLAAATSTDLPTAAKVMANAMNVFSLAPEDAAHVADVITTSLNESTADIHDFAAGMRTLGPVVANFGGDVDDAAAAIATFTNYGLRGADAGVSLARGITMAARPTDEARQKMADLGITVFDTQGKFVGFPALFDNLQQSMGNMSDEEREAALSMIFGAEAADVMALAVKHGSTEYNRIRGEMDKTGTAADAAATRLDNLAGDVEKLRGTLETIAIQIFDQFNPAFRAFIQFLDRLAHAFSALPPIVKLVTGLVLSVGGAALSAAGSYLIFGNRIRGAFGALKELNFGLTLLGDLLGAGGGIVGGLGILGVAYATNIFGFRDAVNGTAKSIKKDFDKITAAAKPVGNILDYIFGTGATRANKPTDRIVFRELTKQLLGLGVSAEHADAFVTFLTDIKAPLRNIRKDILVGGRAFNDFFDIITGGDSSMLKFHKRLNILFGKDIGQQIYDNTFQMRRGIRKLRGEIEKNFGFDPGDLFNLNKMLLLARRGIIFLNQAIKALLPILGRGLAFASGIAAKAIFFLARHIDDLRKGIDIVASVISHVLNGAWDLFSRLIRGDVSGAIQLVLGWFDQLGGAVRQLADWVLNVAAPKVVTWTKDLWKWLTETAAPWLGHLAGQILDWILDVAAPAVGGWISDQAKDMWGWLVNSAAPWVGDILGDIKDWFLNVAAPTVTGWIVGAATKMWDWLQRAYPYLRSFAGKIASWVLDVAVPKITGAVVGFAKNIWDEIVKQIPGVTRIAGRITNWVLDVAIPKIIGAVTSVAGNVWDILVAQYPRLKSIAGTISDWFLNVALPTVTGPIATFARDPWTYIVQAYRSILHIVGDVASWTYNVGLPTVGGQIRTFAQDVWGWLVQHVPGLGNIQGRIEHWTLGLAVPSVGNTASDVVGWVQNWLDRLPQVRTILHNWLLHLDDPQDTSLPDLTGPIQKKADQNQSTSVLLTRWFLTLFRPDVRMSDQEISNAIDQALSRKSIVAFLLDHKWTMVLGTPAIVMLTQLPKVVNQFLNAIDPVRAQLDKWNIDLTTIGLIVNPITNPIFFAGVIGGKIQNFVDQAKVAAKLAAWSLGLDSPDIIFTVGDVIVWVQDEVDKFKDMLLGGPDWSLQMAMPSINIPVLSEIVAGLVDALKLLGDIDVGWPNSWHLSFGLPFVDLGGGKDGLSNTDIGTQVANALAKSGPGGGGGEFTMKVFLDIQKPNLEDTGLDKVQSALDAITGKKEGVSSLGDALALAGSKMSAMAVAVAAAQIPITNGLTTITQALQNRLSTAATNTQGAVQRAFGQMGTSAQNLATAISASAQRGSTDFQSKYTNALGATQTKTGNATSSMAGALRSFATNAGNAGQSAGVSFRDRFGSGMDEAKSRASGAIFNIGNILSGLSGTAFQAGYISGSQMGAGLVAGLNSQAINVFVAAQNLAAIAEGAMNKKAQIASPSRVFMRIGQLMTEGLIVGLLSNVSAVSQAASLLVDAASPMANVLAGTSFSALSAASPAPVSGSQTNNYYNIDGIRVDQAEDLVRWGKFVDGIGPGHGATFAGDS